MRALNLFLVSWRTAFSLLKSRFFGKMGNSGYNKTGWGMKHLTLPPLRFFAGARNDKRLSSWGTKDLDPPPLRFFAGVQNDKRFLSSWGTKHLTPLRLRFFATAQNDKPQTEAWLCLQSANSLSSRASFAWRSLLFLSTQQTAHKPFHPKERWILPLYD